ncbi:hypothetical protein BJ165DRAFT_1406051 [Panaeolus papilionaceus]|nr:hypothetical protein BJ165DRAFT_1406051 [Panaeolus papilionaceus]
MAVTRNGGNASQPISPDDKTIPATATKRPKPRPLTSKATNNSATNTQSSNTNSDNTAAPKKDDAVPSNDSGTNPSSNTSEQSSTTSENSKKTDASSSKSKKTDTAPNKSKKNKVDAALKKSKKTGKENDRKSSKSKTKASKSSSKKPSKKNRASKTTTDAPTKTSKDKTASKKQNQATSNSNQSDAVVEASAEPTEPTPPTPPADSIGTVSSQQPLTTNSASNPPQVSDDPTNLRAQLEAAQALIQQLQAAQTTPAPANEPRLIPEPDDDSEDNLKKAMGVTQRDYLDYRATVRTILIREGIDSQQVYSKLPKKKVLDIISMILKEEPAFQRYEHGWPIPRIAQSIIKNKRHYLTQLGRGIKKQPKSKSSKKKTPLVVNPTDIDTIATISNQEGGASADKARGPPIDQDNKSDNAAPPAGAASDDVPIPKGLFIDDDDDSDTPVDNASNSLKKMDVDDRPECDDEEEAVDKCGAGEKGDKMDVDVEGNEDKEGKGSESGEDNSSKEGEENGDENENDDENENGDENESYDENDDSSSKEEDSSDEGEDPSDEDEQEDSDDDVEHVGGKRKNRGADDKENHPPKKLKSN